MRRLWARLDRETRHHHADADRFWFALVDGNRVPTESDYINCLVRAYGFEGPLEAALAYTSKLEQLVDMNRRYRAGLIAQDLLMLGLSAPQIARLPQAMIAPFARVGEALGWLYVRERATIAHAKVHRELVQRVSGLRDATAYLSAYEGNLDKRIDDLALVIEDVSQSPVIEDRIVSAANEAFRTLLNWCEVERSVPMRTAS